MHIINTPDFSLFVNQSLIDGQEYEQNKKRVTSKYLPINRKWNSSGKDGTNISDFPR